MAPRQRTAMRDRSLRAIFRGTTAAFVVELNPQNISLFFILALAYFITGKFAQHLGTPFAPANAFWPPAGIALAAIFLKGRKALPGILVGAFLVNVTKTGLVSASAAIAIGNTLEAMAGVYLVNRFANGLNAFFNPKDILRFFALAGLLPTALCGLFGVSLLCWGGALSWPEFWRAWSVWWVGDLLGIFILGPFLVLLFGFRHHTLSWSEITELCILLGGLAIMCMLNFGPPYISWVPPAFASIPFLLWAAVRFCPLEVSAACLLMSTFAVSGSLRGFGPYANTATAPFMAAAYVSVFSVTAMFVVAALTQQRSEIETLYAQYHRLKNIAPESSSSMEMETQPENEFLFLDHPPANTLPRDSGPRGDLGA
jgi:two-component system, NarL family, sensor histidine kinase FusK